MAVSKQPEVADIDLPWEKVKRLPVEAIRDDELLAVILKTGYGHPNALDRSTSILRQYPVTKLLGMCRDEIRQIKGIGATRSDVLIAAFELAKRGLNQGLGIMPSISQPKDVIPIVSDLKDKKKEYFVAIFLNARNQVICREDVSVGSLNASLVHPREIFGPAVGSTAASVVLVHNHPSGVRL